VNVEGRVKVTVAVRVVEIAEGTVLIQLDDMQFRMRPEEEQDVELTIQVARNRGLPIVTADDFLGPNGLADWSIDSLLRRHVETVLVYTQGDLGWAADELGISVSTLWRWRQDWNSEGSPVLKLAPARARGRKRLEQCTPPGTKPVSERHSLGPCKTQELG
jgi:hypothetical protein